MENRFAFIRLPNISHLAGLTIDNTLGCINLVAFIKITVNNNVWCNKIVVPQCSGQQCILCGRRIQISKMLILSKITCFELVIVTELENRPVTGTVVYPSFRIDTRICSR